MRWIEMAYQKSLYDILGISLVNQINYCPMYNIFRNITIANSRLYIFVLVIFVKAQFYENIQIIEGCAKVAVLGFFVFDW